MGVFKVLNIKLVSNVGSWSFFQCL